MKAHLSSRTGAARRGGRTITGAPSRRVVPVVASKVVPEDTPGAVLCGVCGVYTMSLAGGNPVSHAAGGYPTSIARGQYRCEGSGNVSG